MCSVGTWDYKMMKIITRHLKGQEVQVDAIGYLPVKMGKRPGVLPLPGDSWKNYTFSSQIIYKSASYEMLF